MSRAIFPCFLVFVLAFAPSVWGQSTISDRPIELTVGNGVWGVLLPAYELGTNANGSPAFRDNLDDVGYFGDLKAVRRFLGTRTSFETRAFYGYSQSTSKTGAIGIDVPNPATGASTLLTGNPTSLASTVDHYGFEIALRDTWRTRFGGLSGGIAFSYMAFDQAFEVDYGSTRLMDERLNSDFRGGKALFGWDGCIGDRPSNLDLVIGFYDMNAVYHFTGQSISGSLVEELTKNMVTIEPSFTTRTDFRGYQFGWTFGVMYISDMPTIKHNVGAPVTIGTDDAVLIKGMFEILL